MVNYGCIVINMYMGDMDVYDVSVYVLGLGTRRPCHLFKVERAHTIGTRELHLLIIKLFFLIKMQMLQSH